MHPEQPSLPPPATFYIRFQGHSTPRRTLAHDLSSLNNLEMAEMPKEVAHAIGIRDKVRRHSGGCCRSNTLLVRDAAPYQF